MKVLNALLIGFAFLLSTHAHAIMANISGYQIKMQVGENPDAKTSPITGIEVYRLGNWDSQPTIGLIANGYELTMIFNNDLDGFKEYADTLSMLSGAATVIVPKSVIGNDAFFFQARGEAVCSIIITTGLGGKHLSPCSKRPAVAQ